jgi:hypothetical protein
LASEFIRLSVQGDDEVAFDCDLFPDETASYPKWERSRTSAVNESRGALQKLNLTSGTRLSREVVDRVYAEVMNRLAGRSAGTLPEFLVYCPENSALRTFQSEGQILPLGMRGEGLFAHLKALGAEKNKLRLLKIKEHLTLIDWFESFDIPEDLNLVIHIDTDVQEAFNVPRRERGRELSVPDRVDRVIARLKQNIDPTFYQANAQRVFVAIAVDTIECWLLPLLFREANKAAKTTGCVRSANRALRRRNLNALSSGQTTFIRAYEEASSPS